MNEILYKYFRDDNTMYFQSSDSHKDIEGDTYFRYNRSNGKIELWMGGNNGEICLCVASSHEKIEQVIKAIIY